MTETMYSAAYDNREVKSKSREGDMAPSKVDAICDHLREAMERTDASRFMGTDFFVIILNDAGLYAQAASECCVD